MQTTPQSMGLNIDAAECTCLAQMPLWWCPNCEAVTPAGGACDRALCYGSTREGLQAIEVPDLKPAEDCPFHGHRPGPLEP